ncbi:MAG: hydroxymethylglutaryl-CoA lyase [Burkholderiaceae bacterium]|jgi:hydroxymethylglutaryl-CoA lyase|nr:hydroxymethylglutaryl-CoA lyase [Burkholderiaceae bacterium]MDP4968420.1 hydroxymethylglutaryl-CoA lyase [Burkholderiaceae bacterium]MDP5111732.1 hydroxymethylglutaryl-CoA lyase [Burkholderiaceae bacterium]
MSEQSKKFVTVTEVGTRDGFQAEPEFISTADKVATINGLIDSGVRSIEATSFVSPRALPQLADAAEVLAQVHRNPNVRLAVLVPNARGAERAAAAKADMMVGFISASESHCKTNLNKSIDQAIADFAEVVPIARQWDIKLRGAVATAFGCPFEGEVSLDNILKIVGSYDAHGIRNITFGDTTGMATPPVVTRVVDAVRNKYPDMEIALHFHNTRGVGLANVMNGLQLGVREFESSIAGLGGCPFAPGATGNICTEDLVYLLEECGYETGIDLEKLIGVAKQVEQMMGRQLPGQMMKAGPRLKLMSLDSVRRAVG